MKIEIDSDNPDCQKFVDANPIVGDFISKMIGLQSSIENDSIKSMADVRAALGLMGMKEGEIFVPGENK